MAIITGGSFFEDQTLKVTGTLGATTTAGSKKGTYGTISVTAAGLWTYTPAATDIAKVPFNATVSESIVLGDNTYNFTITGVNDDAKVAGTRTATLTEGAAANVIDGLDTVVSGVLTVIDADTDESKFRGFMNGTKDNIVTTLVLTNGTFNFNPDTLKWTYKIATLALEAFGGKTTATETATVVTADGGTSTITVTLKGANDRATIVVNTDSTDLGATLTEDLNVTNGLISASGNLNLTGESDTGENKFAVQTKAGTYGTFSIDDTGAWTYKAINNANLQSLTSGSTKVETMVVKSFDGLSSQTLTITIAGATNNNVGGSGSITESNTGKDTAITGSLVILDNGSALPLASRPGDVTAGVGKYGSYTYTASTNKWTYTADSTKTAVDTLKAGETLTDFIKLGDGTVTAKSTADVAALTGVTVIDGVTLVAGDRVLLADQTTVTQDGIYVWSAAAAGTLTRVATEGEVAALVGKTYVVMKGTVNAGKAFDLTAQVGDGLTPTEGSGDATIAVAIKGVDDLAYFSDTNTAREVTEDASVVGGFISATGDLNASFTYTPVIATHDDDPTEFLAGTSSKTNGVFTVAADGTWTYKALNNSAALQKLAAGATLSESFVVKTADGKASTTVSITLKGADNATEGAFGSVTESNTATAAKVSGVLSVLDTATNFSLTATPDLRPNDYAATSGSYGIFTYTKSTNKWTYELNSNHATVTALNASETLVDTLTLSGGEVVNVLIKGANDLATVTHDTAVTGTITPTSPYAAVSGAVTVTLTEDKVADMPSVHTVATSNIDVTTGGLLTINGYTVSVGDRVLVVGQSTASQDGIYVAAVGAWSQAADSTGNLTGKTYYIQKGTYLGQGWQVTGTVGAGLTAVDNGSGGKLSTAGKLLVADGDNSEALFVAQNVSDTTGVFTLATDGTWTYVANNNAAAVQKLTSSATSLITKTFTAKTVDGVTQAITVKIAGDSNTTFAYGTPVLDADITSNISGTLSNLDGKVVATAGVLSGTYGKLIMAADGKYTYSLSNKNFGAEAYENIVVTSNSTSTTITIKLTKDDLPPVISGDKASTLTLTGTTADVSGTLTISDPDAAGGAPAFTAVVASVTATTFGSYSVNAGTGVWTYNVDDTNDTLEALTSTQSITDTFIVVADDPDVGAADGSTTVTIVIKGKKDAPAGGPDTNTTTEDATLTSTTKVLANDTDIDAGQTTTLKVSKVYSSVDPEQKAAGTAVYGNYGTLTLKADGSYTYVADLPNADVIVTGQQPSDTFTYILIDTDGLTATATLIIGVTGVEDGTVIGATSRADNITGSNNSDTISGLDGDDIINGGGSADSIGGDAGNDTLNGEGGADTITGGAGFDTINGGAGEDNVDGGADGDTISGGADADTLSGGAGVDIVNGDAGNDTVKGGDGDDTLTGGADTDTLQGEGGNDYLVWDSADTFDGGSGTDTLSISGAVTADLTSKLTTTEKILGDSDNQTILINSAVISVLTEINLDGGTDAVNVEGIANLSTVTLLGVDSINGSASADTITGTSGNDVINGLADADIINGGAGDDTIDGGSGADTIIASAGADNITGGDGTDALKVSGTFSLVGQTFATLEKLEGSTATDTITIDGDDVTATVFTTIDLGANTASQSDTLIFSGAALDLKSAVLIGVEAIRVSDLTATTTETLTLSGTTLGNGGNTLKSINLGASNTDVLKVSGTVNLSAITLTGVENLASIDNAVATDEVVTLTTSTTSSVTNSILSGLTSINLGDGTADELVIQGTIDFTSITLAGVEKITGSNAQADTVTLDVADAHALTHLVLGLANDTLTDTLIIEGTGTIDFTGNTLTSVDIIKGDGTAQTIIGNTGDNTFEYTANATIDGLSGTDKVIGTTGNDYIVLSNISNVDEIDALEATSGTDTDTLVISGTNASLAGVTLKNFEAISGSGANDTLTIDKTALDSIKSASITVIDLQDGTNYLDVSGTLSVNLTSATITLVNIAAIRGNGDANTITGTAGADVITGGAGIDTLTGGAGVDTVSGGDDADILIWDDADTFDGGSGGTDTDTLKGTDGDDIIALSKISNVETIDGDDGGADTGTNDILSVSITATVAGIALLNIEKIQGSNSDDALTIGTVANLGEALNIDLGGGSNDQLLVSGTIDLSSVNLDNVDKIVLNDAGVTITGTSEADNIIGGTGVDTIILANGSTDTVDGNGGNDIINISGATVVLSGATISEVETLMATDANVNNTVTLDGADLGAGFFTTVNLGAGTDTNDILILNGSSSLVGVTLTGVDFVKGNGTGTITGNATSTTYIYVTGTTINAGVGVADKVVGVSASDDSIKLAEITGVETIDGISGAADKLLVSVTATLANITLANIDTVEGSTLADTLTLNTIAALGGAVIDLKDGANIVSVDGTFDFSSSTVSATGGTVTIQGAGNADTITGTSAGDTLKGGAGADTLVGGSGNDTLYGEAGNDNFTFDSSDIYWGGETAETTGDTLTGSSANDAFALEKINEIETVVSGGGSDSLTYTGNASIAGLTFSGFGTNLVLTGANTTNNLTLDSTALAGFTTVTITGGNVADTLTVNGSINLGSYIISAIETLADTAASAEIITLATSGLNSTFGALTSISFAAAYGNVKAASTANLTLSGLQTVDGVALIDGDRILVKDQTAAGEDGIYAVHSGAWTLEADSLAAAVLTGREYLVQSGTVSGGKSLAVTGTVGTGLTSSAIADQLIVQGTLDMSGKTIANIETLTGSAADDTLTIKGSEGFTSINLGAGTNTLTIGDNAKDLSAATLTNVTLIKFDSDVLKFTGSNSASSYEWVTTLGTIVGTNGLIAGSGADTLYGTSGNDTINSGKFSGIETVDAKEGSSDAFIVAGTFSGTLLNFETLTGTVNSDETITLTAASLAQFTSIDLLEGTGTGDKIILSGTGTFNLANVAGLELVDGDATVQTISVGTTGSDGYTIDGKGTGGGSGDNITGGNGNDTIVFYANDTINGGNGTDTINIVGVTAVTLTNISNIELIAGDSANNDITGSAGNDTITGGDGVDTLSGGSNGVDSLSGGNGNDTLKFGANDNADTFDGGADSDTLSLTINTVNLAAASMNDIETISFATQTTLLQLLLIDQDAIDDVTTIDMGFVGDADVLSVTGTINLAPLALLEVENINGILNQRDVVTIDDGNLDTVTAIDLLVVTSTAVVRVCSEGLGNLVLTGLQTVDGVALNVGDRILVTDQTDATENKVYVVAAGAWTDGAETEAAANTYFVTNGTTNGGNKFTISGAPGTDLDVGAGTAAANVLKVSGSVDFTTTTIANVTELTDAGSGTNVTVTLNGAISTLGSLKSINLGDGSADVLKVVGNAVNLSDAVITGVERLEGSGVLDQVTLSASSATFSQIDLGIGTDELVFDTTLNLINTTLANTELVTGGANADTLTLRQLNNNSVLDSITTIDLNGGADIMVVKGVVDISAAVITEVETLNGTAAYDDVVTVDTADITGTNFTTIALGTHSTGDTLILKGAGIDLTALATAISGVELIRFSVTGAQTFDVATTVQVYEWNTDVTLEQGVAGDTIKGTAAGDTIVLAQIVGIGIIDGGNGTDTLKVDATNDDISALTLTSIEAISATDNAVALVLDDDGTDTVLGSITSISLAGTGDSVALMGTVNLSAISLTGIATLSAAANVTVTLKDVTNAKVGIVSFAGGADTLTLSGTSDLTGMTLTTVETIQGSSGSDIITLDNDAGLTINGGLGADTISGSVGVFVDTITGGDGADTISGGGGADILDGGGNDDDDDVLFGGTENDTFLFYAAETNDDFRGGADTDTLRFTDNATLNFTALKLTDIEVFDLRQGGINVALTITNSNSVSSNLLINADAGDSISVDGTAYTADQTINIFGGITLTIDFV